MSRRLQDLCKVIETVRVPNYGIRSVYSFCLWMLTFTVTMQSAHLSDCNQIYSAFAESQKSIFSIAPTNPPLEFNYTSRDGQSRYFRDGALWQLVGNNWISIGYGRYDPTQNVVYEDSVSLSNLTQDRGNFPDLTPLKSYRTSVSNYEADRYYPNIGAYFPSDVHRLQISNHTIEVHVPKSKDAYGWNVSTYANGILDTLRELPFKRIEAVKTVRVNTRANKDDAYWKARYQNFSVSAAAAGGGAIEIFGVSLNDFRSVSQNGIRLTRHEFGHLVAEQVFGSTDPDSRYINPASRDQYSPSDYARNAWSEDFAEGIESYLRYDAGRLSPQTRRDLLNRFSFFDDVFNYRSIQSLEEKKSIQACKDNLFIKRLDLNTILIISFTHRKGLLFSFK